MNWLLLHSEIDCTADRGRLSRTCLCSELPVLGLQKTAHKCHRSWLSTHENLPVCWTWCTHAMLLYRAIVPAAANSLVAAIKLKQWHCCNLAEMELLPSENCYPFQAILLHAIGLTPKETLSAIGGSGFSRSPAYWVASSALSQNSQGLLQKLWWRRKAVAAPISTSSLSGWKMPLLITKLSTVIC